MKKLLLILLIITMLPVMAEARQGHVTLLTVGEFNNNTVGGTADLFLEIRPGSGRIFIDSFPLTRLDTQISTRFAKEVACDFLEADCSNKDFFYTIRTGTSLVGGPSAGAATTVLTISMLDGIKLNENVVMTGTINSGGLVGPVSGIEEKSIAARNKGFQTVLIPKWSVLNSTENTTLYAGSLNVSGINVITVSTLEEALWYFTGKDYSKPVSEIEIPEQYTKIMGEISNDLCNRYYEIDVEDVNQTESMERANEAMARGDFYSAASFCFGSNVAARTEQLSQQNNTELLEDLKREIREFTEEIEQKEINTFSELEASVIVKERLFEAARLANEEDAVENVAYIMERLYSAHSWSRFFEYDSEPAPIDTSYLNTACQAKLGEVEERLNYLEFISGTPSNIRTELEDTRSIASQEDYAFCLFRATRIKADINALLISVMVRSDSAEELAQDKINLAYKHIGNQDRFSILGYSYFDYSMSLKESNPRLSIIFSEYATEFSSLDMYFPPEPKFRLFNFRNDPYFVAGLFVGFLSSLLLILLFIFFKEYKPRRTRSPPGKKR